MNAPSYVPIYLAALRCVSAFVIACSLLVALGLFYRSWAGLRRHAIPAWLHILIRAGFRVCGGAFLALACVTLAGLTMDLTLGRWTFALLDLPLLALVLTGVWFNRFAYRREEILLAK